MTVQGNYLGSDKKVCRDMTGRLRRNTLEIILRVAKPLAICCLCLNELYILPVSPLDLKILVVRSHNLATETSRRFLPAWEALVQQTSRHLYPSPGTCLCPLPALPAAQPINVPSPFFPQVSAPSISQDLCIVSALHVDILVIV
jgi:hypothetical protein